MSALNFEDTGFQINQANAWLGIDPNMDQTPWGGISTLGPTDLGSLRHLSHLPNWQGIRNPVSPLIQGITKNATVLLDQSSAPTGTFIN